MTIWPPEQIDRSPLDIRRFLPGLNFWQRRLQILGFFSSFLFVPARSPYLKIGQIRGDDQVRRLHEELFQDINGHLLGGMPILLDLFLAEGREILAGFGHDIHRFGLLEEILVSMEQGIDIRHGLRDLLFRRPHDTQICR